MSIFSLIVPNKRTYSAQVCSFLSWDGQHISHSKGRVTIMTKPSAQSSPTSYPLISRANMQKLDTVPFLVDRNMPSRPAHCVDLHKLCGSRLYLHTIRDAVSLSGHSSRRQTFLWRRRHGFVGILFCPSYYDSIFITASYRGRRAKSMGLTELLPSTRLSVTTRGN